MDQAKANQRLQEYQKQPDQESMRRRREQQRIELRKTKRTQQFASKRRTATPASTSEDLPPKLLAALPALAQRTTKAEARYVLLVEFLREQSDDELRLQALQLLRKGTAAENRQIAGMIEVTLNAGGGVVLEALLRDHRTEVQVEALWCLINISSEFGMCGKFVSRSLILRILDLARSADLEIVENCVWILGNIAGEGKEMVNFLQSLGTLQQLLTIGRQFREFPLNTQCMLVWALGNHYRDETSIPKSLLFETVLLLKDISRPNQEAILMETSWALQHISGGKQGVQAIVQAGFIPHLVSLLEHSNVKIVHAALRTLGNVVREGEENEVESMVQANFLQEMERLTGIAFKSLHRELLWILGNLALPPSDLLPTLLQTRLVDFALQSAQIPNDDTQLEVSYFLISVFTGAVDTDFAWKVYDLGALEAMRSLLHGCKNSRIALNVLAALDGLMQLGKDRAKSDINPVAAYWEELGGITLLEGLQSFPSADVYNRTVEVMDKHYGLLETNENVELAEIPDGGRFEFS